MESTTERVIEIEGSTIWLDARGILRLRAAQGTVYTRRHLENAMAAFAELSSATARPLVVETPGYANADIHARHYWRGEHVRNQLSVLAVVVSSPVMRVIATFLMRIAPPAVPCQLFEQLDEALLWATAHVGS
jgi:hypothetical protein